MRLLLWFILLLIVVSRYLTSSPFYKEGEKIRITAKVSSEPLRFETYQRLSLAGLKVYLPAFPEVMYGDQVIVEGVVEKGKLKGASLVRVAESQSFLTSLRKRLIDFYKRNFPEPHASLVAGITLGAKSTLPSNFWEALTKTGTSHVVVASGMNVTLVASFLMSTLLIFLSRRKAIPAAIGGVWLYTVISGLDAPLVRAAIMGSLAFSAQELGKVANAWRILVFSALIMLIIRPDWIDDLGFILSFVATASLMLFERRVRKVISFVPEILKEGASTSLAAQIGVGPILFVTFGYFNLLSPIINALVLWTVPFIMIIGLGSGIVGIFYEPLGKLFLYLAYPLTAWFVWLIQIFNF